MINSLSWRFPPVKLLVTFYFISAFAVFYPLFLTTKVSFNFVNFLFYYGYLYFVVFKIKGLVLFKEFRTIIEESDDIDLLIARTNVFLEDKRYLKLRRWLIFGAGWMTGEFLKVVFIGI